MARNMINAKIVGMLIAAFVAGTFVASPELRAYAANTIGSADIIDGSIRTADIGNGEVKTADLGGNSVTAAKIKDGEVKAAEIAIDAVGGEELQGVTKLLFIDCIIQESEGTRSIGAESIGTFNCLAEGIDNDDIASATLNDGSICFVVARANAGFGGVQVGLKNECGFATATGSGSIAVIVYDK